MKKFKTVLLILVVLFAAFLLFQQGARREMDSVVIHNVNFSDVKDGTYQGESKVGPVEVITETTVKDGKIVKIDLIKHVKGLGGKAEPIIDQVIKNQRLDIDVISGATASSKAILQSIENGINQGK
ncbi:FMN-binding protein [Guggenheimella bovis]